MKRVSDKMRIVLAISVICLLGFTLSACGAEKVEVPLDAASFVEGARGNGADNGNDEEDQDAAAKDDEEEDDSTKSSSTKRSSKADECLDFLAEQNEDADLSRTEKCEECLCDECSDEIETIIDDGKKAINVLSCAEEEEVTGQCLMCEGGNCRSTVMGNLGGIRGGRTGGSTTLFDGPCAKEVCSATSIDCTTVNGATSLVQACVAGQDNPCGHALDLLECMAKNCESPVCKETKAITCEGTSD
jgi:hypothetical protein